MSEISLLQIDGTFSVEIMSERTTTGAGDSYANLRALPRTYQASISGTGAVEAEIHLEVSNDGVTWLQGDPEAGGQAMIKFPLSGTGSDYSGAPIPSAKWPYIRANVISISGTNAAVTVTVGG